MTDKTVDIDNLFEEIFHFSDYLDREYEALYPIVVDNDYIRDSSKKDQKIQIELERRLDLINYIRNLFQERIESIIK